MTVKFMWNGIKVDGELYKAHYYMGNYTAESGIPEGTITIYGKHYIILHTIRGLTIENDSDAMTDYFENDRVRVAPDNKYYSEVKAAYEKMTAHNKKRFEKKYGKAV